MFKYLFIGSFKLKFILIVLWLALFIFYVVALGLFFQILLDFQSGCQRETWWVLSRGIIIATAMVGVFLFSYAWFIEPYRLEICHKKLQFDNIKNLGKKPLRIVHISDFHCDATVRNETTIPGIVARLNPDCVIYTGDSINAPEGLNTFQNTLRSVARFAPVYAVRGNWDEQYWKDIDLHANTGAKELSSGRSEVLNIRGTKVFIGGIGSEEIFEKSAVFPNVRGDELQILLCHRPQIFNNLPSSSCHLVCTGHTHGGQVNLPVIGPLLTFSKDTRRYTSGLFSRGEMVMNVNRGIGMEGGLAPRIRFLARPEITLLLISGK